jgi:hypothetical protein
VLSVVSWRRSPRIASSLPRKPAPVGEEGMMGRRRANQLWLNWRDEEGELPEAVREEVRALVAQILRVVAEAERDDEETDGE